MRLWASQDRRKEANQVAKDELSRIRSQKAWKYAWASATHSAEVFVREDRQGESKMLPVSRSGGARLEPGR